MKTAPTPDLSGQAFRLVIDGQSGRVEVHPPGPSSSSSALAPRFSLLGQDALQVIAGNCAFSPIPDKPKYKRCTLGLDLRNLLVATDLVTPTTFPRPPQGTTGILAFPWTAVTDANVPVDPSPDWDLGPANFFNDFAGCSSGDKSDCYRYEPFASPLYAGQVTTGSHQVGFDIPISALYVTAYIVVAADLRDNPVITATLGAVPELCGFVDFLQEPPVAVIGDPYLYADDARFTFCSFPNRLPAGARIRGASLRVFSYGGLVGTNNVLVQRVNWGPTLEPTDVLLPTLNNAGALVLEDATYAGAYYKWYITWSAGPGVQGAVDEGQAYIQFRLLLDPSASSGGIILFGAGAGTMRPQLVVEYTQP